MIAELMKWDVARQLVQQLLLLFFLKNGRYRSGWDSKKLSAKKRAEIFEIIKEQAAIGIGIVDAFTIDKITFKEASEVAMKRAIELLPEQLDYLLIDAMKLDTGIPEEGIIGRYNLYCCSKYCCKKRFVIK